MKFSRKAKRELTLILLFCSSLPLMYLLFFGEGGFLQLREYRSRLHELQLANRNQAVENEKLLKRIEKIKSDPAEMERIAREEYNMARPGDIIITVPKSQ